LPLPYNSLLPGIALAYKCATQRQPNRFTAVGFHKKMPAKTACTNKVVTGMLPAVGLSFF
jgi:hypothetical protein